MTFNINKICFLSLLFLAIFSNSFTEIEKAQEDNSIEQKWDFLEKTFINDVNSTSFEVYNIYAKIPIKVIVVNNLFFITWLESLFYALSKLNLFDFYEDNKKILKVFLGISLPLNVLSFFIIKIVLKEVIVRGQLLIVLEDFLNKYDFDLQKDLESNTKKLVPEEFYEIFDFIHKKYLIGGREYLEKDAFDMIYKLINKIELKTKNKKSLLSKNKLLNLFLKNVCQLKL